jgi:adenylate kinase family enzyme
MRVAIIGNSGSGKSTLALQMARGAGVAVLDLDTVAWVPGKIAVPQDAATAAAAVESFCQANRHWVIEGCYTSLIQVTLKHEPHLIFLDPGVEQCVANCEARPWEPHKYSCPAAQDRNLAFLIEWVKDYEHREGETSRVAHQALFEAYAGPKQARHDMPAASFLLQAS